MQFQQSEENLEDADGSIYKVGCVFLMVIWSEFCMGQYRDDDRGRDRREDTLGDLPELH